MKKIMMGLLLCLLSKAAVLASPVYPRPHQVTQPDGTRLTLVGHGDEFCHYTTTTDGYTIVLAEDGFYHYATERNGKLLPTLYRASDVEMRSMAEMDYVASLTKDLRPEPTQAAQRLMARQASLAENPLIASEQMKPRRAAAEGEEQPSYRGLVLLVEFNDCKFSRTTSETKSFYQAMLNQRDFTFHQDKVYGPQSYTGSLKDYFCDQSYEQFVPEFDIVGPVTVNRSQYYINAYTKTADLTEEILAQVDEEVDYSQYDSNGDGDVDMIYIIYAGYSSNYEGNDSRLVWPHASTMIDPEGVQPDIYHDGKRMARYACSAEIFGWKDEGYKVLDGIGVICHEFSHVLGFMDHYDVQGYQEHPNTWDVMAAGNYNGEFNRTPCGYNSYEKAVAGFLAPRDISQLDDTVVELQSMETSQDAAIIYSTQEHVSFFMDNRQPDKWDKYLPGHGLLVWRVDSIRPEYWTANYVNVTTRACFRLVRACGTQGDILSGVEDKDFDPFPGTRNVTSLDNLPGVSNLLSYDKYASPVTLSEIAEEEGKISFRVNIDPESEPRPISYDFPDKFVAMAERLVGDEWVPVTWTVGSGQAKINNQDSWVLFDLLPNEIGITSTTRDYSKGVYVYYGYNPDCVSGYVDGQRVAMTDQYGIWLCDRTDVANGGSGSIQFKVNRYGIPTLLNPEAQLAWCALKKTAVRVSENNITSVLDIYRNIHFYEEGTTPEGIEQCVAEPLAPAKAYDLMGREVKQPGKGLFVVGGKIIPKFRKSRV